MFRLEIRIAKQINHCINSYERKASPVFNTWEDKCIAISNSKEELMLYVESLPIDIFFDNKILYKIEERNGII